jgi:lipoate-protein ligase A
MNFLDFTFPTPAENLACDEALLDWCEEEGGDEILRFWQPSNYFVVVGYANKVSSEANVAACTEKQIPILRRCSGGGTVLQGPGCLDYSLILNISANEELKSISSANRFIMERNRQAIEIEARSQKPEVRISVSGHTDLSISHQPSAISQKFSGNAQRRKKNYLLFHGTFLLHLEISQIEKFLPMPSKQPEYRRQRSHSSFLANLNLSADLIKRALCHAWNATVPLKNCPSERIALLTRDKYVTKEWNFKF